MSHRTFPTRYWLSVLLASGLWIAGPAKPAFGQGNRQAARQPDSAAAATPLSRWADLLASQEVAVRREALAQLGTRGRAAAAFAPAIARLVADPVDSLGFTAAWALALVATEVYPHVKQYLKSSNPSIRERAVYSIGAGGRGDMALRSVLREIALNDPNKRVRDIAGWAATEVVRPPSPDRSLTTRAGTLQIDPDMGVKSIQRMAAEGFDWINIFLTIRFLDHPSALVRKSAMDALVQSGPLSAPLLSSALKDRSPRIRMGAVLALARIHQGF